MSHPLFAIRHASLSPSVLSAAVWAAGYRAEVAEVAGVVGHQAAAEAVLAESCAPRVC